MASIKDYLNNWWIEIRIWWFERKLRKSYKEDTFVYEDDEDQNFDAKN